MLLLVYQTSLNYVEKNKFSIIWFDVFFLFAPVIYHLYSTKIKKRIIIKRNSIVLPSSECGALYLNQIA